MTSVRSETLERPDCSAAQHSPIAEEHVAVDANVLRMVREHETPTKHAFLRMLVARQAIQGSQAHVYIHPPEDDTTTCGCAVTKGCRTGAGALQCVEFSALSEVRRRSPTHVFIDWSNIYIGARCARYHTAPLLGSKRNRRPVQTWTFGSTSAG